MASEKLTRLEQQQAELQRKQDEIKAKIRAIKSKEQAEKRKKATHYKVLLGAFWLNEIINNSLLDVDRNFPKLRKFINDDKKFDELSAFINEEIEKGKK
jgi:hypothetical protein